MRTAIFMALTPLVVSGCAQRAVLEPAPRNILPVAPYGAKSTPDAESLLTPDPQAAPARNAELRRRSEERADDPFDLPPE